MPLHALRNAFAGFLLALLAGTGAEAAAIAFVDITVIDGTGAAPRPRQSVLVEGQRIVALGAADEVQIPPDALRIDGRDAYLLPGFIDSNVHASIYGNARRRETVVRYGQRNEELVVEFVQRQLRHGVTTVRDSFGQLEPLLRVRERIKAGTLVGPRLLVAGNIVGWGGPFSLTFSLIPDSELTLFQEHWNESITQGVGEELMDMTPQELAVAIDAYLDKGPDFVKYGGTSHFRTPSLIGFSPRAQSVIVERTHRRGLIAETHATSPEALLMAIDAGVDLVQHPEILSRPYPDELLARMVAADVLCAIRSNTLTGVPWKEHQRKRAAALEAQASLPAPFSSAERRRREEANGELYETQRRNAERLIAAGCRVTIATDNYQGDAPEFRREPKPEIQEAGIGSILAIEGLVELGMSEMQALVAATRNGAAAAGGADAFGTIEAGKIADLIVLDANPLRDISNIRRLRTVMSRGRLVDLAALPEKPVFTAAPEAD